MQIPVSVHKAGVLESVQYPVTPPCLQQMSASDNRRVLNLCGLVGVSALPLTAMVAGACHGGGGGALAWVIYTRSRSGIWMIVIIF